MGKIFLYVGGICLGLIPWKVGAEETNAPVNTKPFVVMAYNVENLMDADRVAPYDEYAEIPDDPNSYGPTKLLRKLKTIAQVLKSVRNGAGPDVVILNELEVDHTPETAVPDMQEIGRAHV